MLPMLVLGASGRLVVMRRGRRTVGGMAKKDHDAVRITTATRSRSDDISARQRRYVISMTIRTICFVLAIVSIGHWFMWAFIIASFILPYVAVVMANAGASPDPGGPEPFESDPSRKSLDPPPEN